MHQSPSIAMSPLSPSNICPESSNGDDQNSMNIPTYGATEHLEALTENVSIHPMQMRSKSGIFQPKLQEHFTYYSNSTDGVIYESRTVQEAMQSIEWKSAREEEMTALKKNGTWTLVSSTKRG